MAYYVRNKEKNGIEIYFDGKPEEIVRDELKKNKWRWTNIRHCWWHYYDTESEEFAKKLCNGHEEQSPLNANEQTYNFQTNSSRSREKSVDQSNKIKSLPQTKTSTNQVLDLNRVMQAVGGVYVNRDRLRGVMKDLYPQSILDANILLAVYESGIPKALSKKKSITSLEFTHYVDQIVKEYGLQVDYAIQGIEKWLNYEEISVRGILYSGKFQKKENVLSSQCTENRTSESTINVIEKDKEKNGIKSANANVQNKKVVSEHINALQTINGYNRKAVLYNGLDIHIDYRGLEHYSEIDDDLIPNIYVENLRKENIEVKFENLTVNGFQNSVIINNRASILSGNKYLALPSYNFVILCKSLEQCQISKIEEIKFVIIVQLNENCILTRIPVVIQYNPPFAIKRNRKNNY